MSTLILLAVTLVAVAISFLKDRDRTRKALMVSYKSLVNLAPGLLGLTGLIGLVLALLPPESMANLFQSSGPVSFLVVSLVGAVAAIPGPVAFPLAGSLLELGASMPAVAAFITTLTMVGVVSIPMEAEHFGRRFTLLRNGLSFAFALVVGGLMGVLLG